jgi:hypothetical protein
MISERKVAANRKNAQRSTGPRTVQGKARSRQNALRHGLAIPVQSEPNLSAEAGRLAQALAGQNSDGTKARSLAFTDLELRRVDRVRNLVLDLITSCFPPDAPSSPHIIENNARHPIERTCLGKSWHKLASESARFSEPQNQLRHPDAVLRALAMLENLERYQRRALSRRNRALQDL